MNYKPLLDEVVRVVAFIGGGICLFAMVIEWLQRLDRPFARKACQLLEKILIDKIMLRIVLKLLDAVPAMTKFWSIHKPQRKHQISKKRSILNSFPSFWDAFKYLLPEKTRREAFEPAYNDMLNMFIEAKRHRRTPMVCWLVFCFTFRTVLMVADCFRVMLSSQAVKFLSGLLPDALKNGGPANKASRWIHRAYQFHAPNSR